MVLISERINDHGKSCTYRRGCALAITGLQLPSVTACSVPGLRRCGSRLQDDHLPGWPGARELRRLAPPAGRCGTAIQPVPWRPETMQGDSRPGRRGPQTRFAFTRTPVAPSAGQYLPGPVGIADADARVHVPGGAGPARRGRTPAATRGKASWSWPGPEPVRTPAARPAWSQRAGAGGSMMSAACRSARAIRSRGLTLCSSSVSSETSSRNGVTSSTPGSPPVLATRLARAAWAVRRAWSARRPATRPLSRVPSATATSRPVPGLAGVSGAAPGCVSRAAPGCVSRAAPGCVSRAAPGCGSSDTTITSLRDPGRPGAQDGQERCPPGSCLHGNHL